MMRVEENLPVTPQELQVELANCERLCAGCWARCKETTRRTRAIRGSFGWRQKREYESIGFAQYAGFLEFYRARRRVVRTQLAIIEVLAA